VFVSSTLAELADERTAVARAISSLQLTPILFELGARPHPPQELYRAYLRQSDIFIGLYWQRYGWVGPGMEISGLEDEFQLSQGMPRLLYLKNPAPEREDRLTAMIGKIESEAGDSYRTFRSPRELGRLVRNDLATLLSERFAEGQNNPASARSDAGTRGRPDTSLPLTSTTLVGREDDIAEVCRLLETPEVRFVTLTGPGGIGKTRLAIAVAQEMVKAQAMKTVFLPLAAITEPELVLPRIVEGVGAAMEGTRPAAEILAEHLAGAPALLVLDNLEQVVSAGPDIDDLLTHVPGLKILATSRIALRLRAEHEYAVEPLTVPVFDDRPSTEEVASLPAVRLFVDRAQAVRRDFALTPENAVPVAEICQRLDGLPLAIELAASRTRLLEPAALLARLGTRLDSLGSGPVDLPERQRTLRATIEWSVGLLNDEERKMLSTLSVFVDGWTMEAGVAVAGAGEEETLDLLVTLSRHSLVHIAAGTDGPRFRMLETIREFVHETAAASPDFDQVEKRHASYFRQFVENTVWPFPDEATWAERIQAEDGNLRLAIRWYLAHDIEPLPHMFHILWRFWELRDRMAEGRAWLEELRPQASTLGAQAQAELWLTFTMTAVEAGDDEPALAAVTEMDRARERVDDPYLESAALLAMSWTLPIRNDLAGAVEAASKALEGFRQQDQPFMAANAAFTLGMLELAHEKYDAATQHLDGVQALNGRLGNNWLTSVARVQLASLAVDAGRLDEARRLLQENVGTERSTLMASFCLVTVANLALAEGDAHKAAIALGAADGLRNRAGLRAWPMLRPREARLLSRVKSACPPEEFSEAFAAGAQLSLRQAIDLARGNPPA
jgi:predicted ATPase